MATHSSILAWRIPGMAEPGGLPSMGSHRVGHDWSDLALALSYSKVDQSQCQSLLSFSLISWLTEVHLVFSTRRAHQMFQMFISCLFPQWHFTSVLVFAYNFSWGLISIAPLFSGMEICSWEIWDQPYFSPLKMT